MAALTWAAITNSGGYNSQAVSSTGAVGDTFNSGATDGMRLDGVGAFIVIVQAAAGQTITTAGGLTAYVQDPHSLLWVRAEAFDCAAGTVTGVRGVLAGAFTVTGPAGRIGYQNNGFAVSSGNLTIRIIPTGHATNGYGALL